MNCNVETRDAANHGTKHKRAPATENYPTANINTAEADKPCPEPRESYYCTNESRINRQIFKRLHVCVCAHVCAAFRFN